MNKYLAFASLGFRQARSERGELLGRIAFFVLILTVFSAVWHAVADAGVSGVVARAPAEMLWYLVVTEWVTMSPPMIWLQIEDDVRRGDVAYQIARPVSWLGARFAHGLGGLALRGPVLLVVAFVSAWVIAGPPQRPLGLAAALAFGVIAAVLMTLVHVSIGIVAFWLGDVAPAFWIWQKLLFVLGGLLLPLHFYPELFVLIARLTPFPALLAGPASFATSDPLMNAGVLALTLGLWAVAGWVVARAAFERAVRRLHVNGG